MQFLSLSSTDPALNLALEECLLQWLPADHPGLFLLWQNAPSVIVGRHQVTLDEIDADFVRRRGLPVVRRMTGGGAVYHDLGNLNFSFMENAHGRKTVDFARYLRPVCAALAELGVQASLTGRNDLEAGGRKISGSAQSLRQGRILHHGTLLVSLDFGELVQALHVDPDKIRSKGIASVRSRVANISEFWTPGSGMEDLRAALLRHCADGEGSLEPEVLRAMEHSALEKPCYLPIGKVTDGQPAALLPNLLVDTAEMGRMARYIDSLLHRVAREIGDGNIDADPCTRGPQDSACTWCAFRAACWFDEKRDKPRYLRKITPEEFWQTVDREVEHHG